MELKDNMFWDEFDKQIEIIAIEFGISKDEAKIKLLEAIREKMDEDDFKTKY